jgi:hypothetical protein
LRLAFGRCIEEGAYNALKTAPDAAERAERKAAIARRLRDEHGLDITLCGEALDILEGVLYEATPTTHLQSVQQDLSPAPVYTTQSSVYATPKNATEVPLPAKKHTIRNVLITVAVIAAVIVAEILARGLFDDSGLRERAMEMAHYYHSDAFESYDFLEPIKHYYFIPLSESKYGMVPSWYKHGNIYTTDSGVIKARAAGYRADYGLCVYRGNDGKIAVLAAPVTQKN